MQHNKGVVAPNHTVNQLTGRFFKALKTAVAAVSAIASRKQRRVVDDRLLEVIRSEIRHEIRHDLMVNLLIVILLEVGFHVLALLM